MSSLGDAIQDLIRDQGWEGAVQETSATGGEN